MFPLMLVFAADAPLGLCCIILRIHANLSYHNIYLTLFYSHTLTTLVAKTVTIARAPRVAAPVRAMSSAKDVVIPELVDTLEWVLESPPNVHQFDEPPLVVEVEHLKALEYTDPN